MSDAIIKVENLGKKYIIGHQVEGNARYTALRDVIVSGAKSVLNSFQKSESQGQNTREEFWALKDVSFEVKQGETVGIIGRNGAGKSTLLKVLSRITEPTTGEIRIRGRVASLLEVGTGFHPELTGRENIYLNGAILGMSRLEIRRKFDEIVAFAEVEKFLDTPVKHYSSGMYVRLAFAVAAHLEPEILIVDEVLAVGDAAFQKKCLGKMGDVATKEGRTVLFVSHNMTAVKSLCQRGIWLNKGMIVEVNHIDQVVNNYLQTGNVCQLEQVWSTPETAPGNEQVRLHYVGIFPEDNDEQSITVNSPLNLVTEFWNNTDSAEINLSINVFDISENHIFNSFSLPQTFSKGLIRIACRIPGDLLNDETYRVEIMIVKSGKIIFCYRDAIVFEVSDGERNSEWYGKWSGVIRPKLTWKAELLEVA